MRRLKKIVMVSIAVVAILVFVHYLFFKFYKPPRPENYGRVDAQLFLSDSIDQPLIVAFGGSQGGNTWSEDYWAGMRNRFLQKGYAVLSIGYFKTEHTPQTLDRISLNAIYDTIKRISHHPKINPDKIALLGSSRGGELALILASKYKDIDAVVALVPGHRIFPAGAITPNSSAWTFDDQELPYLPIPYTAILASVTADSHQAWDIILKNENDVPKSVIEVEKINGPILLLSAKQDETWPSHYMCDQIVNRLRDSHFHHYYEHHSFDGGHYDTQKHFDKVFEFLSQHFQ